LETYGICGGFSSRVAASAATASYSGAIIFEWNA
jgi:hypothetical protein